MILSRSDIKYTFRQLFKNPGFALLSVIVLAGGLGISLFTLSFIYTMSYKPLELPDGERIIEICGEGQFGACVPLKAYEFASFRAEIETLENIGVYSMAARAHVRSEDAFFETAVAETEVNMFQFAESGPILGRVLQDSDVDASAEPVAVLSYDFWQLAFSGDPSIVGSHIEISGIPTLAIGVMPEGFTFPRWTDVWIPAPRSITDPARNDMDFISIYGYLKPGVSHYEASQEIANLMSRMRSQFPFEDSPQYSTFQRTLNSVDSGFVTSLPTKHMHNIGNQLVFSITTLLSLMLFLLACINVGTLLLARTNERLKDVSIRVALGAPRRRLLLQTMGESIVIALLGTILAILLTGLFLEFLNIFLDTLLTEEGLEFWMDFKIEGVTLLLAFLFAFFTILITSAWPSWRLINGDFNAVMRDGTRGAQGLRASRFSRSLVVVAVTLISVLVYTFTVFGTVIYSLGGSFRLVEPNGIYSLEITTGDQISSPAERLQFARTLQNKLEQHPDTISVLMAGVAGNYPLALEGQNYFNEQDKPNSPVQVVDGDVSVMAVNLLEGRLLDSSDTSTSTSVAMVSRSLAERLWPNQSAVGEAVQIDIPGQQSSNRTFRIVGMVSDSPIDSDDLFKRQYDMIYLPLGQFDSPYIAAIVRSRAAEQDAVKTLADTALGLHSGITFNILSWLENRQMTGFVINAAIVIFMSLGVFAFLISIAGIFGLTKNSILLRTQEIGTRRALGAPDSAIGRSLTMQGAKQALLGMFIAFLICAPVAYLIGSLSEGENNIIPGTIISIFALSFLFVAVVLAIYSPIRKLLRKEPSDLLRHV